ncbi:snRNA-activating protein complex subunit-like isoform X3 [Coffea eugenioides]|uniref:snRNA-activating protein complex subunit-like isoform X3 n=1 Tax=Coffea eugenioides TaxID=49369 RepID=UPI000F61195E|nr:snRNA-activating protein complex subunit-like isoform X3 [Coffea eugenioides]
MSAMEPPGIRGEQNISIPHGGPIYSPHMLGRLTRVSEFESSVFEQLQNLKADIGWDSLDISDDEICVNDLKIIKEEDLVNRAFEEALKDAHLIENIPQKSQEQSCQSGSCRNQSAASSQIKNDKLTSLKSTSFSPKVGSSKTPEQVPVHFPEVILCLEVYHNRRTWSKTQEFLVLGRQFLTEVRDMIYCLTDEIMKKAGKHDASGYFLVEDVFCNDTRDPYAIDYSKPIFKWLEHSRNVALEKWEFIVAGEQQQHQKRKAFLDSNEKLQLPHFKVVDMQKTRFCDLGFRLGAGYLYCHQGDCKHLIVIRDMRLIHPEDVQNRAAYPLITFQSKVRFRKCSVCNIYKATKVTVDDKWAQENPCYFCDLCYYMLHYADGSLLYSDFSVYDYLHE